MNHVRLVKVIAVILLFSGISWLAFAQLQIKTIPLSEASNTVDQISENTQLKTEDFRQYVYALARHIENRNPIIIFPALMACVGSFLVGRYFKK
jgi:hypothetical protein